MSNILWMKIKIGKEGNIIASNDTYSLATIITDKNDPRLSPKGVFPDPREIFKGLTQDDILVRMDNISHDKGNPFVRFAHVYPLFIRVKKIKIDQATNNYKYITESMREKLSLKDPSYITEYRGQTQLRVMSGGNKKSTIRKNRSRSKRKVSRTKRKKKVSKTKTKKRISRKRRKTRRMRGGTLEAKAEAERLQALAKHLDAAKSLSGLSGDPAEDMEEDAQAEERIQRNFSIKVGTDRMETERDDTNAYIERVDLKAHTVPELQKMCHEMGFRTTGTKEELVARLLLVPYYNDLNKIKERHRAEHGALTLEQAQEQSDTYKDTGFLSDRDLGYESYGDLGFESD